MATEINNINPTDLTVNLNSGHKRLYKRWWFWIFLVLIVFIWISVSILYAYFTAQKNLSETTTTDTTVSDYELIYTLDDPNLGNPQARIQIVEFSDFQCPYCAQSNIIMRELLNKYPNDFYYIYRDFPLDDIHPQARLAAEAAVCAHQQQKFWSYHDLLFQNQTKLELGNLLNYAQQVGLDKNKFTECLESSRYQSEVKKDQSDGITAGVNSTPTFFVNGEKVEGVIPLVSWEKILNIYLR